MEHRASFRNSSSWKKISRKTRFRAAELKIPIRFQSRLSFLDPLFVFPAIFLRVPRGFFPDLSQGFSSRSDHTRYCAPYRNNVYTPETRYRFPMQLSRFFFPIYISLNIYFSPKRFFLKRFPYDKRQHFEICIWYGSKVPIQPSPSFVRLFFFSLSLSLPLQRLFSRLDPFVAVHREREQRLCSFEMGVSILRKESSFFAGRWKRRCTIERGGNLENGNSASFDFFQGERYRVSARGIVGIVSMVGSGFNAVPRVFYSREMEPPFVAFFLDITTFIDAAPSRILVSLSPPPPPPTSPCNCSFEMEREKIFHPLSSRFFMCSAFRGFFWVVSQTAYVSLTVSTAIERQIAREEAKKKEQKKKERKFYKFPQSPGRILFFSSTSRILFGQIESLREFLFIG